MNKMRFVEQRFILRVSTDSYLSPSLFILIHWSSK